MATAAEIRAKLEAQFAGVGVALTLGVAANLREACPVDTGNARAGFHPGIDGTDPGSYDAGVAAVMAHKAGDGRLSVTNNVPYIDRLIGGSSSQAPAGWDVVAIADAVAEVQAQYDNLEIDVSAGGLAEARVVIRAREVP